MARVAVAVAWVAWVASSREHKAKSEIHYSCECPFYHDLRETLHEHTKLIKNYFVTMGIQEKKLHLMKHLWREVSCYLVQSYGRIICITLEC